MSQKDHRENVVIFKRGKSEILAKKRKIVEGTSSDSPAKFVNKGMSDGYRENDQISIEKSELHNYDKLF
ncbi:hypothetical protein [Niallia sp. BSM11]|uniref:hypothetical protein n=1 Tax=Niallia sp. BSM11 TaxID=3391576 RepID=UPI003984D73E